MRKPSIVVVDYHKGNLSSVVRGLARAGADAFASDDPMQILNADGIVLPGVGSFYDAIAYMAESGQATAVARARRFSVSAWGCSCSSSAETRASPRAPRCYPPPKRTATA